MIVQRKKLKIRICLFQWKGKNTILEITSKRFITSKFDHQMSKYWKRIGAHIFDATNKFDRLKNWVPDCSAQDRISAETFRKTNGKESFVHKVFGKTSALQPKTTQPSELYKAEAVHSFSGQSSLGVPGVRWQPQILAHHLTLSQTGGTDYAPTSLLAPPDFQIFRRPWF